MIDIFIYVGLILPVSNNYIENFFNNKNYQDNSHKQIKWTISLLQIITY
jgi:hypothetical protein